MLYSRSIIFVLVSYSCSLFASAQVKEVSVLEVQVSNRKRVVEYVPQLPLLKKAKENERDEKGPNDVISSEAQAFQQERQLLSKWGAFLVQEVLQSKTDEELCRILQYAREYLSYYPWAWDELAIVEKCLCDDQERISGILEGWQSDHLCQWPHQTRFEAWMGHMFFPVQCEYLFEIKEGLHLREHMQNLLAYAASYKNTLAQRHVLDIIPLYMEEEQEEYALDAEINGRGAKKRKHKPTPFETYFGAEAHGQLEEYTAQKGDVKGPPYFCGMLNLMHNNFDGALACFKVGDDAGDPWSMYKRAHVLNDDEERALLQERLLRLHKGLASLLQGENSEREEQQRVSDYVAAGEAGVAQGYKEAGMVCENAHDAQLKKQAYEYYCLAAQNHLLEGYERVAKILIEDDEKEEAQEAYALQGQWGDSEGYVKQGVMLLEEEQNQQALDSFRRAGLTGYAQRILCASRGIEGDAPQCDLEAEEKSQRSARLRILLKRVKPDDE